MARRGPKPKPTALHKLHGTFNATRHRRRAAEPIATGDLLAEPPPWLTESQAAGWRYAVENAPRGVLKAIDAGLLGAWIVAEDMHRTATVAQARLDAGAALPLLTKGREGNPVASPYVRIITRAALMMLKAGAELGFSPSARAGLGRGGGDAPPTPDPDSPWIRLRLLQGGKLPPDSMA